MGFSTVWAVTYKPMVILQREVEGDRVAFTEQGVVSGTAEHGNQCDQTNAIAGVDSNPSPEELQQHRED